MIGNLFFARCGRARALGPLLVVLGLGASCAPAADAPASDPDTALYTLVSTLDGVALYPPLGPEPAPPSAALDASLLDRLSVLLEATDAGGAVRTVARFDASTRSALKLFRPAGVYFLNVPAAEYFTDAALAYRLRVLAGPSELARSDLSARVFEVLSRNPGLNVGVKVRVEQRPAPELESVSPDTALPGSGELSVTVRGRAFLRDSVVRLDGAPLATTFVSAAELHAIVPAPSLALPGARELSVHTAAPGGGTTTSLDLLVINPRPALSSLEPAGATAGDGALGLTLHGAGFLAGAVARLDGEPLPTTVLSDTTLAVTLDAAQLAHAGLRVISVSNPSPAVADSEPATFTVSNPSPTLDAIAPASAAAGSGDLTLSLSGAGFVPSSQVRFGEAVLAAVYLSPTLLTATLPAALLAAAGTSAVWVSSEAPGGGDSATALFVAVNAAPVLASFAPASALAGAGDLTLTVVGASFLPGATVNLSGRPLVTTFLSSTALTAAVPAAAVTAAGQLELYVSNPAPAEAASVRRTFTVSNPAPVLGSLTPASATVGGVGLTLTLGGAAFVPGAEVHLGGATLSTTFVSATALTAVVPAASLAAAGTAEVTVTNPAPSLGASVAQTFTVQHPTPVLASVAPATALQGGASATVTLSGASFVSGASATVGGAAMATTYVSSTQLTAVVPAGTLAIAGTYSIVVANPAPVAAASGAVSYTVNNPVPALTSLAPANASASAAALTLTVNGSAFVGGAEVRLGGAPLVTTFVSATRLTAALPASALTTGGTFDVTVANPAPSAGASAALGFTVNNLAPTLTSLTPSSAAAGAAGLTLTVDGASFQPSSTVSFGGATLVTTFVSATRLTAQVPTSALATWGTLSVTVSTPAPGGGASGAATFTLTARLTDGLIAQYDFEETSGAVIDRSGNGNNLTLNGATRLAAGYGAAPGSRGLACSGGQTATAQSSTSLRSPRDQLTIAGWIKPTVVTGDPGVVSMAVRGGSSQAWGFYLRAGAELGIFTNFPSRSSSVYDSTTSGANIRANEWAHVAVVIDYPARQARYYKNGALIYTGAHQVPLDQLSVPLTFCSEAGTIQDYSGQLDDFSIWGRALSSDEIATVARQLTGTSATVLGSGTTCATILSAGGSRGDGLYALDPDGLGGVPPMITYCDMSSDGGGWTLVGNQVGSAQISSVTSDDINPQNDGALTSTFRLGNARIQAFTPTVGWRMRALNASNVVTDLGYLRPQCVVNWLRMVGIRTSDCNAVAGVTLVSALDTNCGILYTNTAFTAQVSGYTTSNCALGIGQNNSGGFCSMRFSSVGWGSVPVGAALPCDVSRTSAVTMQLWLK